MGRLKAKVVDITLSPSNYSVGGSGGLEGHLEGIDTAFGLVGVPDPLLLDDGSAAAPTYSFTNGDDSGMYVVPSANDDLNFATDGVLRFGVNNAALTSTVPFIAPDGLESAPGYAFASSASTGMYLDGSGGVSVTVAGSDVFSFDSGGGAQLLAGNLSSASGRFLAGEGTQALPAHGFSSAGGSTCGMFWDDGNTELEFAVDALSRLRIGTTNMVTTLRIQGDAGSLANPTFSFAGDTNTGMYLGASPSLDFVFNGVAYHQMAVAQSTFNHNIVMGLSSRFRGVDGNASSPSFAFNNGTSTGMYFTTTAVNFATGGGRRMTMDSTDIDFTVPLRGSNGAAASVTYGFDGGAGTGMYADTAGNDSLFFATDGVSRIEINNVALVTSVPIRGADGAVGAPTYSFSNATNTGMYLVTADLKFAVAGTELLSMNSSVFDTTNISQVRVLTLADEDGTTAIQLGTTGSTERKLANTSGTNVVDFDSLTLSDGSNLAVDWSNRTLNDGSANTVVDFSSLLLSDGSTTAVDWSNRLLVDGSGNTAVDFTSSRFLVNGSSQTVLDWEFLICQDSSGNFSIDWAQRILGDSGGTTTLDWGNSDGVYITGGFGLAMDQISAPSSPSNASGGIIYFDSSDGDLYVVFANGTVASIAVD